MGTVSQSTHDDVLRNFHPHLRKILQINGPDAYSDVRIKRFCCAGDIAGPVGNDYYHLIDIRPGAKSRTAE